MIPAYPCWHCSNSGACICILCGKDTREGRQAGPCVACAGRAFAERHRAVYDAVDPRERRHWRHKPAADGNPVIRIFKPTEGLK